MPRITVYEWLKAIETADGPEPELRHVCYVLGRFMSGDGSSGCFPSLRTIAARMGVSHAAAGRRAHKLRQGGWIEVELRRRQYGREGAVYFPAIPMERLSVPIGGSNGTPERSNQTAMERSAHCNGTLAARIGTLTPGIGTPERSRLLLTLTEESAATPSPADAGFAARKVRDLLGRGFSPTDIAGLADMRRDGITLDDIQTIQRTPA
jgi:hypothetical protein